MIGLLCLSKVGFGWLVAVLCVIIVLQLSFVIVLIRKERRETAATKADGDQKVAKTKKTRTYKHPALVSAVKAVAVLVCICLVCVALLAICNDVLYVSDEVRLIRKMKEIYPSYGDGDKEWNQNVAPSLADTTNSYGTVSEVHRAEDGAYVITAVGSGGYGGDVSVYLVVKQQGEGSSKDVVIMAWTFAEADGETLLTQFGSTQFNSWYKGKSITAYTDSSFELNNNKVTGATLTSTAVNNAVKAACDFCVNVLKLVSTPESEAREAVSALLPDYTFTNVTDSNGFAEFAVGDQTLDFYYEGVGGDGQVEAYVYGTDENRQIVVVKAGLTHQERLAQEIVVKSDNAADEVVQKVKSLSYFEYMVHTYGAPAFTFDDKPTVDPAAGKDDAFGTVDAVYTSSDGTLVITATGIGGYGDGTATVNVVIANGVIKGWWIVSYDASQTFMASNILSKWDTVKAWFVGASVSTVQTVPTPDNGQGLGTGATFSERSIINAVNMACKYARSLAQ